MADATEALRTLSIAHAELQRRCRKQAKLRTKTVPRSARTPPSRRGAELAAAHKALEPEAESYQEHAEKARLTYQRRSTAEAAGSGAVRAAEGSVDEPKRPKSVLEKLCRSNRIASAYQTVEKCLDFTRQADHLFRECAADAGTPWKLSSPPKDVFGVASPSSPVQARSPNVHDGSWLAHATTEASKRLAEGGTDRFGSSGHDRRAAAADRARRRAAAAVAREPCTSGGENRNL